MGFPPLYGQIVCTAMFMADDPEQYFGRSQMKLITHEKGN